RARPLDGLGGVLLGVPDAPRPRDTELRLHRDDLLLLYTDGLVARRGRAPPTAWRCCARRRRSGTPRRRTRSSTTSCGRWAPRTPTTTSASSPRG
ncbi:SpoIIE family protein phosphatase, partial [Actinomadura sp. CNU-125]|uniref:SpoIIE family protein phosphatase n=1 Tax=Actinomadura sp. CNU-125 TaxID=1904961 RepID=UPI00130111AD